MYIVTGFFDVVIIVVVPSSSIVDAAIVPMNGVLSSVSVEDNVAEGAPLGLWDSLGFEGPIT